MNSLNYASVSEGAKLVDFSSELEGCSATHVLDPQLPNIWLSEEGLPQWLCISLDGVRDKRDLVVRTIGWHCWHAYATNPREVTVHVSSDGAKFKIWDTFAAQQTKGTVLFCCAPISASIYPFIALEVTSTHGGLQTYMNRVFFFSDEVPTSPLAPGAAPLFNATASPLPQEGSYSNYQRSSPGRSHSGSHSHSPSRYTQSRSTHSQSHINGQPSQQHGQYQQYQHPHHQHLQPQLPRRHEDPRDPREPALSRSLETPTRLSRDGAAGAAGGLGGLGGLGSEDPRLAATVPVDGSHDLDHGLDLDHDVDTDSEDLEGRAIANTLQGALGPGRGQRQNRGSGQGQGQGRSHGQKQGQGQVRGQVQGRGRASHENRLAGGGGVNAGEEEMDDVSFLSDEDGLDTGLPMGMEGDGDRGRGGGGGGGGGYGRSGKGESRASLKSRLAVLERALGLQSRAGAANANSEDEEDEVEEEEGESEGAPRLGAGRTERSRGGRGDKQHPNPDTKESAPRRETQKAGTFEDDGESRFARAISSIEGLVSSVMDRVERRHTVALQTAAGALARPSVVAAGPDGVVDGDGDAAAAAAAANATVGLESRRDGPTASMSHSVPEVPALNLLELRAEYLGERGLGSIDSIGSTLSGLGTATVPQWPVPAPAPVSSQSDGADYGASSSSSSRLNPGLSVAASLLSSDPELSEIALKLHDCVRRRAYKEVQLQLLLNRDCGLLELLGEGGGNGEGREMRCSADAFHPHKYERGRSEQRRFQRREPPNPAPWGAPNPRPNSGTVDSRSESPDALPPSLLHSLHLDGLGGVSGQRRGLRARDKSREGVGAEVSAATPGTSGRLLKKTASVALKSGQALPVQLQLRQGPSTKTKHGSRR